MDSPASGGRRRSVLVIDDDVSVCAVIRRLLQREVDVGLCSDAEEAIRRLCGSETPDLILCDLMMPGRSGADVFNAVVSCRPELKDAFVFMTGGAYTACTLAFMEQPWVRRLEKPFEPAALLALVRAGCASDASGDSSPQGSTA